MNILHLNPELNISCGVSRLIHSIMSYSQQNFKHHVICFSGDGIKRFIDSELIVKKYRIINIIIQFPFFVLYLYYYCKANNIHVIHSHHRLMDFGAFIVSRFSNIKTITNVHSKVTGKKNLSYKAEQIITCSESIKSHLVREFKLDKSKIKVIYNFVNPSDYHFNYDNDKIKREYNIPNIHKIILFVGRVHHEKGIDVLIDSFKKLSNVNANISLVIVGKNYLGSKFLRYLRGSHKIIFVNPDTNIGKFYSISDIVVLPSRVDPFPITMIEAGLFGKALVGSNVDGISEFIENDINGLLVKSQDADVLSATILDLLKNKEKIAMLGNRLKNKVFSEFVIEKKINDYFITYAQLLNRT